MWVPAARNCSGTFGRAFGRPNNVFSTDFQDAVVCFSLERFSDITEIKRMNDRGLREYIYDMMPRFIEESDHLRQVYMLW